MSEVTWTVTAPSGEVKRVTVNQKLEHIPAMRIPEKATGAQVTGATNFNKMRQRLLDLGEMESK